MNDKHRSFWILLLVFGLLTIGGLMINQSNQSGAMGEMMSMSMGGMMKQMHASNLTVAELLQSSYESHGMSMEDSAGHHEIPPLLQSLGFLSTMTIFILLPLILGGAALLLVLWI